MNMKSMGMGLAVGLLLVSMGASAQETRARAEIDASADSRTITQRLAVVPPKGTQEVSVALQVQFDFGKADLTAQGRATMDNLALALNSPELLPNVFVVEGHTDTVGSDEANLKLSKRRAETVTQALVERGVAAVRLTPAGFGELRPIPGIAGTDGRNRRVEVVRRVP